MRPTYTVAGVQDGSFESFKGELNVTMQQTILCCTEMELDKILDIRLAIITVDGLDATSSILKCIEGWDLDAILLGGASYAGFNIVDFENVYDKTGYPIIVLSSILPDIKATRDAIRKHFSDWKLRLSRYDALSEIHTYTVKEKTPPIYFEVLGCSNRFAERVIREQAIVSRVPEAIRVADLIAKGVSSVVQGQAERFDG